jgi:coenzyme F420-reducing hydrogenase delta subunit/formate hydrogenlyase subunit 6/NADH:ubiquinone oxidoreductase subunit I
MRETAGAAAKKDPMDKVTRGIELDDSHCGRCSICSAICPYDAISVDPETKEVKIDEEKCQFCGICVAACPVKAIEIVYYGYDKLLAKLEGTVAETNAHTLVLMCRGNSPPPCDIMRVLDCEGYTDYIPLRLPCVGRVPTEFILKALTLGLSKIVVFRCEEDFCRFEEGSRIGNQRLLLAKQVLQELGYAADTLEILTRAKKAVYNTDECVGCDKCVFVCPYEAIDVEQLATPKILLDKCVGCGACAMVCPHAAIQVEGFEHDSVAQRLESYGVAAKELKSKNVSPVILVIACQWSEFSALDQSAILPPDQNVFLMEIPCFKGLDPYVVIHALESGFDGVLAIVCSDSDCKLEKGYEIAQQNAIVLQRALRVLKLEEKFSLEKLSPRRVGDFSKRVQSFIDKIVQLERSARSSKLTPGLVRRDEV